ncbi:hypothetical protein PMZ80_008537 [Knufia obscura]|uniref:glucan endo-1,3-beta-D-glucosidase n=1 Tax=Knufia obscura TaxID=1635080 RepID=A0ABR0RGG9_9EURO|nr:hypothetical protein PMZ80_008537 [Knufia obscura]
MQIVNTFLLAGLAAQLGHAAPPAHRHERPRHHRKAVPGALNDHDIPVPAGPWGNGTFAPTGSRPCGGPTSVVTVMVTETGPGSTPTVAAATTQQPVTSVSSMVLSSSDLWTPTAPTVSAQDPTSLLPGSSPSPSSPSSPSIPSQSQTCSGDSYLPVNYTFMKPYFGLNVVNTKPYDVAIGAKPTFKTPGDWQSALKLLRDTFPNINAVRMYSTSEDGPPRDETAHLMNIMLAAQNNDFSILAGVWSGGPGKVQRFEQELQALGDVIHKHGCGNLAAVSVGNEDLNYLNQDGITDETVLNTKKQETAELLVKQMDRVRQLLRHNGCCNTPVTHTETWNELTNADNPTVNKVIAACDQAVITNIFPYWGNVTVAKGPEVLAINAKQTMTLARQYGKDLWLGETSWARQQIGTFQNMYGATGDDAQQYFNIVGCQVLSGNGTAFYYVDWDQDKPLQNLPIFGLFDFNNQPLLNLDCSHYKNEMYMPDDAPSFLGGKGFSAGKA